MSDIPLEHQVTIATLDDLSRELETLLDSFCSDAQHRFLLEQRVATQQQLQRVRHTIQQIRNTASPATGFRSGPNSEALRQSLMRVCIEMLEYYQEACQQRRLRPLPDGMAQQLTADWHHLSQAFELKAKEQGNLSQLFDKLDSLRKAWKSSGGDGIMERLLSRNYRRSKSGNTDGNGTHGGGVGGGQQQASRHQMERLLTALLVNYELKNGAYVVMVDRHNYCQLGLGRKAIGTRHVVFDCSKLTRQEQMDVVAGICDRFASVFAQNAQHNLAQIEAQIQLAQLSLLAEKLRRLQHQIYFGHHHPTTTTATALTNDDEDDDHAQPHQQQRSPSSSSSISNQHDDVSSLDVDRQRQQQQQLPLRGTSSLLYIQDANAIEDMPMPSFVPSPWEWPDLLKVRHPYHPVFLGLVKRRRRRSSPIMRLRDAFTHPPPPPPTQAAMSEDEDNGNEQQVMQNYVQEVQYPEMVRFASVSIPSLCGHFCRRGRQFYEDVVANAQVRQSQDRHLLQEIGRDLVKIYAAIQLEASRAYMHRILAILHDMSMLEHQLNSSAATTSHHHHSVAAPAWDSSAVTTGAASSNPPPPPPIAGVPSSSTSPAGVDPSSSLSPQQHPPADNSHVSSS
ncbi:hypothetical protein O0I10_000833 [Lichtheimia ornata]|uniref:Uncharacterized protein n=1 Tax=Lichtheimia ornata TaxID=688661 RepID=A0AAD8DJ89_9FUNG|nr:uncharacterized protein O0I10_000833 [Lichtheimia ornata]KAJ8663588.1 hypothetical protein O0I10_000833 [Lichtheimia ornata]